MSVRLSAAFLLVLAPLSAPGQNEPSRLRLIEDSQLGGRLVSLGDDRLVWESPVLDEPAAFWLEKVLDVTFPAEIPDFEADHEATLELTNGDVVRGQLASVTDETVELETWYAGRLPIRRVMVKTLSIEDRPNLLYRGPTGLDGWTTAGAAGSWSYQANAFRSSGAGGIGRDVDAPEVCRFAFTAQWRGSLSLGLNLMTDDLSRSAPQSGYRFEFSGRQVNIQKSADRQPLGRTMAASELNENERARIEVRVSRESGVIALLVDDRLVHLANDPAPQAGEFGTGLQFVASDGSPVHLSDIEVSSWDGHLEQMPELEIGAFQGNLRGVGRGRFGSTESDAAPEESGRMLLRNGDSIQGEVVSIADGTIEIDTSTGKVRLPVARLRTISLEPVYLEEPKRNRGDVRAWFPDGSSLVFRLEKLTPDTITGYSQTFGTAEFKASAFNRIEFNVHDIPLMELRAAAGW